MHHQDQFINTLNIQNATSIFSSGFNNGHATRNFNDEGSFTRHFDAINEELKPFDFVNRVIPVLFKVTGEETIVFNVLPTPGTNTTIPSSPFLVLAPPGLPTKVRILISNTGDADAYDSTTTVSPRSESALGATVVPSDTNIPNVVQQNAIQPLVLIGPSQNFTGFLPVNGTVEMDVTIVPSFYVGGTVEPLFVDFAFHNTVGQDVTLTLPIGIEILPVTDQGALHNALAVPSAVTNNQLHVSNELSNKALNAMTNIGIESYNKPWNKPMEQTMEQTMEPITEEIMPSIMPLMPQMQHMDQAEHMEQVDQVAQEEGLWRQMISISTINGNSLRIINIELTLLNH